VAVLVGRMTIIRDHGGHSKTMIRFA